MSTTADTVAVAMNPPPSPTVSSSSTSRNDFFEPYPRMVIHIEGIPYQSDYKELYGWKMFEYTIPLPEVLFNVTLPIFIQSPHPFQRTCTDIPTIDIEEPPESTEDWRTIACSLHEWLCVNQDQKYLDEWHWVVNLFWIMYMACNPAFPKCPYDEVIGWNSEIVLLSCEHISQKQQGLDLGLSLPAEDIAWLLWQDWLKLRRRWLFRGVFPVEYTSRIGQHIGASYV